MKILVVDSGFSNFIQPLVDWWREKGNEVKHTKSLNLLEINELTHWADVLWIEWANELAVAITRQLVKHCPIIVRCHRYELYRENMIYDMDFDKVDYIIFDADFTRDIFHNTSMIINHKKTMVVPNMIDLDVFSEPLKENHRMPKSLAVMNYQHSFHKNLPLLLECFYELLKKDKDYTLHICGNFNQLQREVEYYVYNTIKRWNLEDRIIFYSGGKSMKQMMNWYRKKEFIINCSMVESTGLNILEGMSQGCIPLIHDWPFREQFYPDRWSFRKSSEFVEKILKYNKEETKEDYREWVKKHFSLRKIIGPILIELLKNIINAN